MAPEQVNDARRAFLSTTAVFAATAALKAQEKKVDGGLAVIEDKNPRAAPLPSLLRLTERPPLAQHCTACQLCISVCPNQVLRPSSDLTKLMQPEMSYEAVTAAPNAPSVRRCVLPMHPSDEPRREIGRPNRSCRMD